MSEIGYPRGTRVYNFLLDRYGTVAYNPVEITMGIREEYGNWFPHFDTYYIDVDNGSKQTWRAEEMVLV